ncbi:MAG: hypothetical protein QM621_04285 [Aeromicrobium sp.]|uniref:hypothetical protein n=1 Tax=Aeromicrobium sp. TaxID=1871063 RepID=UPI0039E40C19
MSTAPSPGSERPGLVARLRSAGPFLLLGTGLATTAVSFGVYTHYFPEADAFSRLYASLLLFTGTYLPLSDQPWDPSPPPLLAYPATVAFLVTLTAVAVIIRAVLIQAIDVVRSFVRFPVVVIVGSDETAAALVRSCVRWKASTVLVTESRDSEAARACSSPVRVVQVRSVEFCDSSPSARRLLSRARHVLIATDSDAVNLGLRRRIRTVRPERRSDNRTTIAVLSDPVLTDTIRPERLRQSIPGEDQTCPADNIAEHIVHLVDVALTTPVDDVSDVLPPVEVELIDPDESTGTVAHTVGQWLTRMSWSRSFLADHQGRPFPTNDDGRLPGHLTTSRVLHQPGTRVVRVYAGEDGAANLTAALRDRVSDQTPPDLTVVLADESLALAGYHSAAPDRPEPMGSEDWLQTPASATARAWQSPQTVIVDPEVVGLDVALVTDDLAEQWARNFHQTYAFMFAADEATSPGVATWKPGESLSTSLPTLERRAVKAGADRAKHRKKVLNRVSSGIATENMLRFLAEDGWELRRHHSGERPPAPDFPKELVEQIAEKEHEDWRGRTWDDPAWRWPWDRPGRTYAVAHGSASGTHTLSFGELTGSEDPDLLRAAEYNRRLARETYPALAALFGYAIVRRENPEQGVNRAE